MEYKTEDQLNAACFTRFWNEYPQYRGLLFHPANELPRGGKIGIIQRMQMKAKGVVPGIPDFVFMLGKCAGIEGKLPGGKPSKEQENIAAIWVAHGRDFFFFDTELSFMQAINIVIAKASDIDNKEPKIYDFLTKH